MHTFCEVENKHFIKNRYLHCNIMNVHTVCISQSGYVVCTFPPMIYKKRSPPLERLKDSSTKHNLLSMEEYGFVTRRGNQTEAKMYPQNLAVQSSGLYKLFNQTVL